MRDYDCEMPLKLVPKPPNLTPIEKVMLRIKKHPKPDGMWQCNRCGSRVSVTVEAGAKTENGHKVRGTILHKDICAECWRRNIIMPMVVKLKATE